MTEILTPEELAAAQAVGATAERARIKSILTCDAAADRPKLAQQVALETDLPAEAAQVIIGAAASETAMRIPSLGERALESPEPGADLGPPLTGRELAREEAEARRQRVVQAASGPDSAR